MDGFVEVEEGVAFGGDVFLGEEGGIFDEFVEGAFVWGEFGGVGDELFEEFEGEEAAIIVILL